MALALAVIVACSAGHPATRPASPAVTATTTASTTTQGEPASTNRGGAPTGPETAVSAPCGWRAPPAGTYQHVVWIWMENHTRSQVLGDPQAAPYEVSLAAQCATATAYRNIGSPSLPNYIGATSGATQGIGDDAPPASHPLTVDNLFRQVRTAGGSERSYQEAMAAPCQLMSAGRYAVKHNPAAYYVGPGGQDRAACQADDVPVIQLGADLVGGHLPTFSFVTPDLCHDTHDCSVSTGDAWLAAELPPILTSPAYRAGSTVVFVVWDEYTPLPVLVLAPSVRPGTTVTVGFDHYALLRTTEELLGLPGRLGATAGATDLRPLFDI